MKQRQEGSERVTYAAAPHVVAVLLLGAAGFGVFAAGERGAGRLLLGAAALGCLTEGLRCLVARPVVAADDHGIHIGRTTLPWAEITSICGRTTTRKLIRATTLEIDAGDTLVHVPAYRLGAPVAEVASALTARRPT
ncbi:MAG TPA: hypothetical protein VNA12_08205 [Mycobacteriales bacterium]|nr:hypothetical protein [Mycobacteriales bacterium]